MQVGNDAATDGAKIVEVTGGGAAAAAGLPSGVVVTKVDDRVIGSADALVAAVRSKAPGDKVTLTYLDPSGKPQTVQVTLGKAAAVITAPGTPTLRVAAPVSASRYTVGTHGTARGVGRPGAGRRRR